MHLGLVIPRTGARRPTDLAIDAEQQGYDSVWMGSSGERAPSLNSPKSPQMTDDVEIGTAIVNVFSRTPAVLAMTAATLDQVSDGRASFGVGTSTPTAVENVHGMAFERPVRRSHETIEIITKILRDDEPVDYDGELLSVNGVPPVNADVPVYHAALGPANRRVVGRLCDGWMPHNIPFSELENAFEVVERTAREADRDPDEITIAPYVPAAVSDDADEGLRRRSWPHRLLRRQRRRLSKRRSQPSSPSVPNASPRPGRRATAGGHQPRNRRNGPRSRCRRHARRRT